jgi:hypothetical protein
MRLSKEAIRRAVPPILRGVSIALHTAGIVPKHSSEMAKDLVVLLSTSVSLMKCLRYSGSGLDQDEFATFHKRFAASLERYVNEANRLCELLAKCTREPLSLDLRSDIALQRSVENEAHAEYSEQRLLLLEMARSGYGDSG